MGIGLFPSNSHRNQDTSAGSLIELAYLKSSLT